MVWAAVPFDRTVAALPYGWSAYMKEPFGNWLLRTRAEKRLSQTEVATRGGLSQGYISDLEKSAITDTPRVPRPKMFGKLAMGLGVEVKQVEAAVQSALYDAPPVSKADPSEIGNFPLPIPTTMPPREFVRIPMLGSIAAGVPLFASQNVEEIIWVDREKIGLGDELITFALRVRGSSMVGAGIFPGDELVVKQAETGDDGDIVVALVDDEATVKRLRINEGSTYLEAEPNQGEKHLFTTTSPWRVIGLVKLVQRRLK